VFADAAPPAPAVARTAPVVLVVADPRGYVHDSIGAAQRAMIRVGGRDGRRVVLLPRARDLTPARLRTARAVVFLDTTGDPPLARGADRALVRFVRRGGGLVVLHAASNGFTRWGAWGALIGARFVTHPPLREDAVRVVADPVTRGVPRRFTVPDEFYVFDRDPRRGGARVLARLAGEDQRPLAWRRREGRGRVFHDALGHPGAAWADGDPRLALVRAGLRWATRRAEAGHRPRGGDRLAGAAHPPQRTVKDSVRSAVELSPA
jgi:type 1 glutamine amidotransferase